MATLYGSNVLDATLTTACSMSTTTGGTETSALTTIGATSNTYAFVLPRAGTSSSFASAPSPNGTGWIYWPGQAGTFAAGNWSASITHAAVSKGVNTQVRFYKYSGGTYTSIGSITATSTATAKTTYSYTATSMSSVTLGASDGIYVDLLWFDNNGNVGGDNPTIYTSNSATVGVANDVQITTTTFTASGTQTDKDIVVRGRVVNTVDKDVVIRARIQALTTKDLVFRAKVDILSDKDLVIRGRVSTSVNKDVLVRGRVKQLVNKDIVIRANIPLINITKIQGNEVNSTSTTTSQAVTLGSGITLGNLVVATVASGSNTTTITAPSGWTQATINQPAGANATIETSIWYLLVDAGHAGQTSFTFTFSVAHTVYLCVEEWNASRGWQASPLDQVAQGDTSGTPTTATAIVSGTTSTTTQAQELWIAALAYKGSAQTESGITAGWTKDLEATLASNNTLTMLYNVANATGAASCQYTIGTAAYYAGSIATFLPIVSVQIVKDVIVRGRIQALINKDVAVRGRIEQLVSKDITIRANIGFVARKDITLRGIISQLIRKDVIVRGKVQALTTKDFAFRGKPANTVDKDILFRAKISTGVAKDIIVRGRVQALVLKDIRLRAYVKQLVNKDVVLRAKVQTLVNKDILVRGRIKALVNKDVAIRARLKQLVTKDIVLRAVVIGPPLTSGGFALYANGSGTVTYDSFRVTQYPDPALSLSPVLPRVGTTLSTWNVTLPDAIKTTFFNDISYDGVNWTNIPTNGNPLPTLYTQPPPIIDGFSSNTSANYTATFQTGGSPANWVYDTLYSRLVVTGGNNALYLYTALTRADVDFFVDMDQSDGGGVVWRYTDSNNFYDLVINDSLAVTNTPNTVVLKKVSGGMTSQLASSSISYILPPNNNPLTVAFTRGAYRRFRVTMILGVITVSVDGVQLLSYTDVSPLSAGQVGLYNQGNALSTRYYQIWIQPLGDYVSGYPAQDLVTGTFVYTRQRLSTTDPTMTPQVEDVTTAAFTPAIGPGVLIPDISYNADFLNTNFDNLAKQSNYSWYVDTANNFHFQAYQTIASPWILQSAPSGLVQAVELEADDTLELDVENDLYRNRMIIKGAQDTLTSSATFVGDGKTTSFTLAYPLAAAPQIYLNNALQSVGTKGQSGYNWYYALGDAVIDQDKSSPVLTSGDLLSVPNYTGAFTVNVTVDDTTEQARFATIAGGTGIVEAVEDHSNDNPPLSKDAATVLATQLINRYAITGRTLIFNTSRNGLQIGQTLSIFLPEHNVWDGQFLINQIEIKLQKDIGDAQTWWYKVTASELPKQASWAKLIASGLGLA